MALETTSVGISTSSAAGVNSAAQSSSANKTSADSSFKDEMNKVSENKKESSEVKETNKADKKDEKTDKDVIVDDKTAPKDDKNTENQKTISTVDIMNTNMSFNQQISLNDANNMLQNDIIEMINNTTPIDKDFWSLSIGKENSKSNISMSENDAQFFLSLTRENDVSAQNIVNQAQNMLNSGADIKEVAQNVKISQTLLNALSESRQTNQPVRIDFDQNVSVIFRVGKDGAISAHFIPGDKAVEQYLKSNIQSLRNTFEEQDLKYHELSYSNSSKEQNQKRRNQQQGD